MTPSDLLDEEEGRAAPGAPRLDPHPAVVAAALSGAAAQAEAERRVGPSAGPLGVALHGGFAAPRAASKGARMFRPRGAIAQMMYDKRPTVGLSGPAGTGKSRGILEKLHLVCEKYPGARVLIARKTRESLTEAALYTLETQVMPEGHPALDGPRRSHRQSYLYPNGSVINVVGLDKPQKVMSTDYDIIYVQEAIECDESDFEMLDSRLRSGIVPYQQLLFDTNPGAPSHWLYQRALDGKYVMYDTRHQDNPLWWEYAPDGTSPGGYEFPEVDPDGTAGRWTQRGLAYLARLDALTGARKARLRHGRWVAAEGQVYAGFSNANMCARFDPPRGHGWWLWSVDFGWTKPFCLQMWWVDPDGRMWLWKEVYHTELLVEDHARDALAAAGWTYDPDRGHEEAPTVGAGGEAYVADLPRYVVCDWDEGARATLEAHLGLRTERATKAIAEGIDAVASRMRPATDKLPRLLMMRDGVVRVDKDLREAYQPTSTPEEVTSYVWDEKKGKDGGRRDVPIDEYNHGMDAMRYAVCKVDGLTGGGPPRAKDVPSNAAGAQLPESYEQKPPRDSAADRLESLPWGVAIVKGRGARRERSRGG